MSNFATPREPILHADGSSLVINGEATPQGVYQITADGSHVLFTYLGQLSAANSVSQTHKYVASALGRLPAVGEYYALVGDPTETVYRQINGTAAAPILAPSSYIILTEVIS